MSTTPQVAIDSRILPVDASTALPDTMIKKVGTTITGDNAKRLLGPNQRNNYDGLLMDLMGRQGGRLSASVVASTTSLVQVFTLAPGEAGELRVSGWAKSTGDNVVTLEAVWKLQNASSTLVKQLKSKTIDNSQAAGVVLDLDISTSGDLNIFLGLAGDAAVATTWRLMVGFESFPEDFS